MKVTKYMLAAAVAAGLMLSSAPEASAFWGQGKLRSTWKHTKDGAKWVGKKLDQGFENGRRAPQPNK